ncbi:MAG: DUF192 domain-containing protein [Candidatus Accumulibacter phosphatis]|uniref:DUF192 domain-containing protein n=1 Tax=Candidatus Accumulibacter phosphatis TaxID=327160 RepID=UPI001A5F1872|nr:DUF192 domain-containing protein [Candidatus Accumulibacter phosphatis]
MYRSPLSTFLVLLLSLPVRADELPRVDLTAGFYRIQAEVAARDPDRMQGLMHRRSMPANHGMLFVFAQAARHCMWMRNTLLPLSVAFLDDEGRILNIEDMQPQTEDNHCAAKTARYALEMNLGWFANKGIKPGTRIGGLEKSPRPQ